MKAKEVFKLMMGGSKEEEPKKPEEIKTNKEYGNWVYKYRVKVK